MIVDQATAANASAGTNLASGKNYSTSNRLRLLRGWALVGSVNPADTVIDIFIGGVYIGTLRNSRGGANLSPNRDDQQAFDIGVLPNELIEFRVVTAPVTNPIVWAIDIDLVS